MNKLLKYTGFAMLSLAYTACHTPKLAEKPTTLPVPTTYHPSTFADSLESDSTDTVSIAKMKWDQYFKDPNLVALIDTALRNNQEINIIMQEIEMSRNEIKANKGEYLPFVGIGAGGGMERSGKYTMNGAVEDQINIVDGHKNPDPMSDMSLGLSAHWEIDIWNKLHNATKASIEEYLATVEGKNFAVTNLVSEIASSYYELLGLDNQLNILNNNIQIQSNALEVVKYEKTAAHATELAVKKFEAEVYKTKSYQFGIQQKITEAENRINFLLGRYPVHITRNDASFYDALPTSVHEGLPAQLLDNRPDIRQAEHEIKAAQLNVAVAKARFYPSLGISAGIGYSAFNPKYLFNTPASLVYNLAGDLMAPLINKNAIKAEYANANAKQIQAVYNYQKVVLNAYVEVVNQMAKIKNLQNTYTMQSSQVDLLNKSIEISNDLFRATRAEYMEVLMTQRDALDAKFDLIETQVNQRIALVNIYKNLGGGWN